MTEARRFRIHGWQAFAVPGGLCAPGGACRPSKLQRCLLRSASRLLLPFGFDMSCACRRKQLEESGGLSFGDGCVRDRRALLRARLLRSRRAASTALGSLAADAALVARGLVRADACARVAIEGSRSGAPAFCGERANPTVSIGVAGRFCHDGSDCLSARARPACPCNGRSCAE